LVGFLDDNESRMSLLGIPRLGKLTSFIDKIPLTTTLVLGVGHVGKKILAKEIVKLYKEAGFIFETIISKHATVSPHARLEEGSCVMSGAVIQTNTTIGKYVIINTGATIDHNCIIGDYTHVAPGCSISGDVSIGKDCLVGIGATIIQGITIADNCIIGAGAVVVQNCTESGTYVGVPAKKIN
jgi:UDP-perosamine 4-acetyltransferase